MNYSRCLLRQLFMILNIREHRIIFIFNRGKFRGEDEELLEEMGIFRSDVALIYNDRAVLENHHVSAAFRLMRIDDYNILSEFTVEEFR